MTQMTQILRNIGIEGKALGSAACVVKRSKNETKEMGQRRAIPCTESNV